MRLTPVTFIGTGLRSSAGGNSEDSHWHLGNDHKPPARQGQARPGKARQGRPVKHRPGQARLGKARPCKQASWQAHTNTRARRTRRESRLFFRRTVHGSGRPLVAVPQDRGPLSHRRRRLGRQAGLIHLCRGGRARPPGQAMACTQGGRPPESMWQSTHSLCQGRRPTNLLGGLRSTCCSALSARGLGSRAADPPPGSGLYYIMCLFFYHYYYYH